MAKPPPRKRAPRKAAKSAPAPAAATPSPSSQPAAVEPPHSTAEEVALLERADVDAPPQPDAAHRVGAAPGAWAAAVWDAVGHLGQPPVRLAALAVNDLGPRAGAWVGWLRKTYPDASATGIARLATRQAARHGWALTSLELGGPLTAPVYLTALGWVRATLALRIAAAYGHDPADPRRADELLELLQLGPEPEEEQAGGLDLAGGSGPHAAAADLDRVFRTVSRRLGVALYLIGRLRPRRGSPVSKAVGAFWSASGQQDGLDQLAHRAMLRYRPGRSS